MSEFEDRLNQLLNDPEQMDRIANLAKSLMSGQSAPQPAPQSVPASAGILPEGFDPAMLGKLGKLLSGMKSQEPDNNMVLLEAMKPYLAEKRRAKMERALKLAKLAKFAELALGEFGGENHV